MRDFLEAIAFGAVIAGLATWGTGLADSPAIPTPQHRDSAAIALTYQVLREGRPVGEHRYVFSAAGPDLIVTSDATARLTWLGFDLYRFEQQVREVWRDGRLIELEARTDDNGTLAQVRARATARGLEVVGPNGRVLAPTLSVATTYWPTATVSGTPLIDTRDGRVFVPAVRPMESARLDVPELPPGAGRRYRVEGAVRFEVWYDTAGLWRKAMFETEYGWIEDVIVRVEGDPATLTRLLRAHAAAFERHRATGAVHAGGEASAPVPSTFAGVRSRERPK